MRLGVGLNDRTRCRGVLNTPHRAPRHGANTRPRAFIHSGPGGPFGGRMPLRPGVSPPGVSPRAMVHRAYSPAGYVPFGPCGPLGGRMPLRPGVSPPRVSPWAMIRRAYSPLRAFIHSGPGARLGGVCRCAPGFRRPGYGPAALQPGRVRAFGPFRVRLGGVCDTPLHRYGHSPRWGVEVLGPAARWFVGACIRSNV